MKQFTKTNFILLLLVVALAEINISSAQCPGTPVVDPIISMTVNPGDVVPTIHFSSNVPGAHFVYERSSDPYGGYAGTGFYFADSIPSFIAHNTSCNVKVDIITVYAFFGDFFDVSNTCISAPWNFLITITAPDLVMASITSITVNPGDVVPAFHFHSNDPEAHYVYSRTSDPYGGYGGGPLQFGDSIPSFIAHNTSCSAKVDTITVRAYVGDYFGFNDEDSCVGESIRFSITVTAPDLVMDPITSITVNPGDVVPAIHFHCNDPEAHYVYSRTSDPYGGYGGGPSQFGDSIPSFVAHNNSCNAKVDIITVRAYVGDFYGFNEEDSCIGEPIYFLITINPYPPMVMNPITSITVNPGDVVPTIYFSCNVPDAHFVFSRTSDPYGGYGGGPTQFGDSIRSFIATNHSCNPIVDIITVRPYVGDFYGFTEDDSCIGEPWSFLITINAPDLAIDPITSITVNSGDVVPDIPLSCNDPDAYFVYERSSDPFGGYEGGSLHFSDTIPSFTAINNTCSPIVDIVTVRAVVGDYFDPSNRCIGESWNFLITINPSAVPVMGPIANRTVNPGDVVPAIQFQCDVAYAQFVYTRSSDPVGTYFGSTLPSFTASNSSCTHSSVETFTVRAYTGEYLNACFSAPLTFTITTNPKPVPVVNALPDLIYNSGAVIPAINFSSNIAGTNYARYRSSAPGVINFGAFLSYTANNTSCYVPLTDTITVIGFLGNFFTIEPDCKSTPVKFIITVRPISPVVDAGPNKIVYRGYADSSCTRLQSTISGGTAPFSRRWSSAANSNLGTGAFINVCPTTTTVYYFTVTDGHGCVSRDSVKVCVIDVRCGSGGRNVIICHGTGSVTNPYLTLCVDVPGARDHFRNHPGEQLGACGMVKTCGFNAVRMTAPELVELEEGKEYLVAFPNPFSASTTIRFMMTEDDYANVKVFDIAGREIATLYDGEIAGSELYETQFDGSAFPDGMYFLILNTRNGVNESRKLILQK